MKKIALAFTAMLTIGTGAASAAPIVITGNSIPTFAPAGLSDAFNVIFFNGAGKPVTFLGGVSSFAADEIACANPAAGGCSFSANPIFGPGVSILPNVAISNLIAVFYEPGSTSLISDIFAIGCDIRGADGKCVIDADNGADFTFVSRKDGGPGLDISALPAGMSVGWTGTEIAGGAATIFGVGMFANITNDAGNPPVLVQFISRNEEVPEPVTLSLFGAGLAGVIGLRRRKKKTA